MIHVELLDLLDAGKLMVYKHFQIDVSKQIEINLITVVPNSHNERAILIQKTDLLR